jgi:hypothetical protein
MQIDVIVLLRGTTEKIAHWQFSTDTNKRFLTRNTNRQMLEVVWQQLALDINKLACDNANTRFDVFLLLRGQLLENLYSLGLLEVMLKAARNHAWGSDIYLVWEHTEFGKLKLKVEKALVSLFHLLLKFGISDLIELPKNAGLTEEGECTLLHDLAAESESRRVLLKKLVNGDGWGRVVLRDELYLVEEFIETLVQEGLLSVEGENLSIFYDKRPIGGWRQLLKKSLNFQGVKNLFVAALSRIDRMDLKDLEELWQQKWPGLKLFAFNGIFEWLYALVRLNQTRHSLNQALDDPPHNNIVWVAPNKDRQVNSEPTDANLCLLVTSSFAFRLRDNEFYKSQESASIDAREPQAKDCIEAANEIGCVLSSLPFHITTDVVHCITCERLPDFLEARFFTAWLHLSHGTRKLGLQEEQELKQFVSHEEWLACFDKYEGGLQLVIFSVCESAELARSFVEEGVARVAVGFENKVLTRAVRKLSGKVMPMALHAGNRQAHILNAFRKAFDGLDRRIYTQQNIHKRYSDAGPKAYAVKLKPS